MSRLVLAAAAALFAVQASAQTYSTKCNPSWGNVTCPEDPALGTTYNTTFDKSMVAMDNNFFNVTAGASLISFSDEGAELAILKQGDSVTIETNFYIFWGTVEVIFRAAKGQGIISTFNMLSDDEDEIDWEIMGGNESYVSNNWYGKGNTSQHNGEYPALQGAMDDFHNYTVNWSQEELQWILDGNVVRTIKSAEAGEYPQTPAYLKFGIWAGGDPTLPQGTIDWAGGKTNYNDGPFTMTVKSMKITDGHTNTSSYSYGDTSGSWQSINAVTGESKAYKAIHKLTTGEKVQQHWSGLSKTAKIAIAASVLGVFVVVVIIYTFVCITQRKKGRAEKAIHDKEWDDHERELMEYRDRMAKGGFAVSHLTSHEVKY